MSHHAVLRELILDCSNKQYSVNTLAEGTHLGPVEYGWDRFKSDHDTMTFGGGLLAGSTLPGTRRMIFCGYSPQWEGFYVSALGGAMYIFRRTHLNYAWIKGQCPENSILFINHVKDQYTVNFEPIDPSVYWSGYTNQSGK